MKFKMAATAELSLTLNPMGKMFQNASSLKPPGQLKANCPGMIIVRSSTNCISANQSILLALAAILNIRLERSLQTTDAK
jgi:hypothetical protein